MANWTRIQYLASSTAKFPFTSQVGSVRPCRLDSVLGRKRKEKNTESGERRYRYGGMWRFEQPTQLRGIETPSGAVLVP